MLHECSYSTVIYDSKVSTASSEQSRDRNNDTSSPLHQVQRLFAFLQESEEMYYNPAGLCKSLKDWEGNSIDVSVQDDASMFLTKLFQELDNALSTSNDRPTHRCIRGVVGMRKIAKSVKFPGKTLVENSPDLSISFLWMYVVFERVTRLY